MEYTIILRKSITITTTTYNPETNAYDKEVSYPHSNLVHIKALSGKNAVSIEVQNGTWYVNEGITLLNKELKDIVKMVMLDETLMPMVHDKLIELEVEYDFMDWELIRAEFDIYSDYELDREGDLEVKKTRNSPLGRQLRQLRQFDDYGGSEYLRIIPEYIQHEVQENFYHPTPAEVGYGMGVPPTAVYVPPVTQQVNPTPIPPAPIQVSNVDQLILIKRPRNTVLIEDRGVHYFSYQDMLMIDWDVDDGTHFDAKKQCLVDSIGEAWEILDRFCNKHPEYKFVMYQTPGGARAFCVSHRIRAGSKEARRILKKLKCDKIYAKLTNTREDFACRLTPKVNRKDDYVAKFIGIVGVGDVDETLMCRIQYHDRWCKVFGGGQEEMKVPTKISQSIPF
jgi:hypothetical protein